MKLDSKRELFGMLEDKKWLFLAEYSDKSLLRNHLAFEPGKRTSSLMDSQRSLCGSLYER